MAKNVAPARGNQNAITKHFAAGAGAQDLHAQASKPQHGAQLVDAKNGHASAAQNAVVVMQDGTTQTIALAPGQVYPIIGPVDSLSASSGADVSFTAYWFHGNSIPFNAA